MTGTCRAAVFPGDGTYEVREFRVPDPPPGGALLQVEAVGLCGSESGAVHADIVAGEVFDLDHIDDAMARLTRSDPTRDAVRVGLRHTHRSTS
jgi:hypothetical protein